MSPALLDDIFLLIKLVLWASIRLLRGFITGKFIPTSIFRSIFVNAWDVSLFLVNLVSPDLKPNEVYKPGMPGYGGIWPQYIKPDPQKDSRSPCPGLNTLANHGILPRDGRNLTANMVVKALCDTWNVSKPMATNGLDTVTLSLLKRDTFDLSDLLCHNMVEHDGSLTREDAYFEPYQGVPSASLISKLLALATGPASPEKPEGYLTPSDISRHTSLRWSESQRRNPQFYLNATHKLFTCQNGALLHDIFGGDVKSCRVLLEEERIPNGFVSFTRRRMGATWTETYLRVAEIGLGISQIP
ncbi:putative chloroperoxidase [Cantharellus anzutake]|uniref:putative chloroperoxidase n=1 Tax=Cantharellus anzutake TaxID=1750568 RepID=UPI0019088328|nr:putative chloroperoxidase [Cantharellus anzutake]KAF8331902.1 putative chloroperoxidase [Cantharellus anzutake]